MTTNAKELFESGALCYRNETGAICYGNRSSLTLSQLQDFERAVRADARVSVLMEIVHPLTEIVEKVRNELESQQPT